MQELRFVLIVVGALAIGALLFHGLWSSKKEGKAKFGNKPLGKLDVGPEEKNVVNKERNVDVASDDDFEIVRKDRKEPDFGSENAFDNKLDVDPLLGGATQATPVEYAQEAVPSFSAMKEDAEDLSDVRQESSVEQELHVKKASQPAVDEEQIQPELNEPRQFEPSLDVEQPTQDVAVAAEPILTEPKVEEEPKPEPEMQVIVLNVHCAGAEPFVGTELFDSMQQNGLIYGEMHIFHRHVDLSGNGKVLFSVANMMHPGTLEHGDPAEFTTKGISFFMTLPCYGEAEQNFNLMLRTAQQIADDLGGNVLDDQRNLMTPDRLAAYRRQIVEFKAAYA
ncbi:Cell division protein ZipA [Vibrio mytili]|uniref:cell division protein ZipA n=1 Tax=Vibrio mytili TaxID=50718 RepID=UPI0039EA2958